MNKKTDFPIRPIPPMFGFCGFNVAIEIDKIKNIEAMYYRPNDGEDIPILYINLKDGTVITIDYESIEDAKQAIKEFKKFKMKKYIQKP